MMTYRILIVDDEPDVREILLFNLRSEGYDVDSAGSSEEVLPMDLGIYDLFILDVMMGKMSGFKLADRIRNELKISKPIVFLTARDAENDMLTGFSLGADDYIRKPFSIVELKARVKAILARSRDDQKNDKNISIASLNIDDNRKEVKYDGKVIELTKKEYQILLMLVKNPGHYITREEILDSIWPDTFVTERTVDVHIARMRKRLGKFGDMIKSRTGYGYFIDEKRSD
ncbi:MAG: response regulator transcription factor [Bacteroidales bacterium]